MTNTLAAMALSVLVATNALNLSGLYYETATNSWNSASWSVSASSINEIRLARGGRMSSPVESVCVVTNVTQWNNEERSPHQFMWAMGQPQPGSVTKEMTERTETTEVREIKTLRFTWEGKEHTLTSERILSRKVKRWARKDNWVEEP